MVQFEEIIERLQAGDKTAYEKLNNILKEREIVILREYYGLGSHQHTADEIADQLGLEENKVIQLLNKTKSRLEEYWS